MGPTRRTTPWSATSRRCGPLRRAGRGGRSKCRAAVRRNNQLTARTLTPQVLQELATDEGLDKFRVEYEKVFRALKKSHGAGRAARGLGRRGGKRETATLAYVKCTP